jgi:hypothetical protein
LFSASHTSAKEKRKPSGNAGVHAESFARCVEQACGWAQARVAGACGLKTLLRSTGRRKEKVKGENKMGDLNKYISELNAAVGRFADACVDGNVDISSIREALPAYWGNGRDALCRAICTKKNLREVQAQERVGASYAARRGVETR